MTRGNIQPVRILLVEDNPLDAEIILRSFNQGGVRGKLSVVRCTQEMLDYLYHRGRFEDQAVSPRPQLILLDVNLPTARRLDVLQQIKQDEDLKTIPLIILSLSQQEEDIIKSYNLGANTYIQKPSEFEEFRRVISTILEYWCQIASPPP